MLTARQNAFVDHFVVCRNAAAAARKAGYSPNGAKVTGCRLLTNANLKAALAEKEAELKRRMDISKATVIGELRAAIDVAHEKLDPGSMIRAWVEISKMLGLYAPEVKHVVLNAESDAQRAKFESMSDEQLLAIVSGSHAVYGYAE